MLSLDEIVLLESLLLDLPSEGSEREGRFLQVTHYLGEFVGQSDQPLPLDLEEVALRLIRNALLDLYQGFRLGTFRGVSSIPRAQGEPPAAQTRLHERLESLLRIEAARAQMFRWFLAGLRHEVGEVLRQRLYEAVPTRSLRSQFVRLRGWLSLSLAEAFRTPMDKENPEHEFGLYGLRLLFSTSGEIRSQEFRTLNDLLSQWAEEYPYFPELEIRDLIRTVALASLSPEQVQKLVSLVLSWRDLERYPSERSFASQREYARAMAQAAGYGKAMTFLAVLLTPLFRARSTVGLLDQEHQHHQQEANRRQTLAASLASLALQDERCFPALLEEIDALLDMQAKVEAKFALMDALPAFLAHPRWLEALLETLGHHRIREFDEIWMDDLRELRLEVSREALEMLLDLSGRFQEARWPRQILENAGGLVPQAEDRLCQLLQDDRDDLLIEVALALHHRRLTEGSQPSTLLENALWQRLERSLTEEDVFVPDDLSRWTLSLKGEGLRRLLLSLARRVESGSLRITPSLSAFLNALTVEASHADRPNPVKLAACWLVDPRDGLSSGVPLEKRLVQAAEMAQHGRFNETVATWLGRVIPQKIPGASYPETCDTWIPSPEQRVILTYPRLASVLREPMGYRQEYPMHVGADRRLAMARALGRVTSPENALPLLADLFQLAVEMYMAWDMAGGIPRFFPELSWEADALALEVLKAVVQHDPVLPQAVDLLEEMFLAQYHLPEGGLSTTFSIATVTQEILPLLVDRHITPQAIPALVELLKRDFSLGEEYRQSIWQCALQWLSKSSTLNIEQQEIVWNVGYASLVILTRSLALLVLGRQRPLSQRVWETVLTLLHTPWRQLYQSYSAEIARLSDRNAWFIFNPGDVFLLSGVAVALTAEWYTEADLLVNEQREMLYQTWSRASSDYNRTLEARLAHSTHPLTGKDWSNAKGLALSLCSAVGKSPDDDPDWLVRPGDLARNLPLTNG